MDEGRAMLAAQPEVLFTYPTPTGHYNKIGRPSLHDRVGYDRVGLAQDDVEKNRAVHELVDFSVYSQSF